MNKIINIPIKLLKKYELNNIDFDIKKVKTIIKNGSFDDYVVSALERKVIQEIANINNSPIEINFNNENVFDYGYEKYLAYLVLDKKDINIQIDINNNKDKDILKYINNNVEDVNIEKKIIKNTLDLNEKEIKVKLESFWLEKAMMKKEELKLIIEEELNNFNKDSNKVSEVSFYLKLNKLLIANQSSINSIELIEDLIDEKKVDLYNWLSKSLHQSKKIKNYIKEETFKRKSLLDIVEYIEKTQEQDFSMIDFDKYKEEDIINVLKNTNNKKFIKSLPESIKNKEDVIILILKKDYSNNTDLLIKNLENESFSYKLLNEYIAEKNFGRVYDVLFNHIKKNHSVLKSGKIAELLINNMNLEYQDKIFLIENSIDLHNQESFKKLLKNNYKIAEIFFEYERIKSPRAENLLKKMNLFNKYNIYEILDEMNINDLEKIIKDGFDLNKDAFLKYIENGNNHENKKSLIYKNMYIYSEYTKEKNIPSIVNLENIIFMENYIKNKEYSNNYYKDTKKEKALKNINSFEELMVKINEIKDLSIKTNKYISYKDIYVNLNKKAKKDINVVKFFIKEHSLNYEEITDILQLNKEILIELIKNNKKVEFPIEYYNDINFTKQLIELNYKDDLLEKFKKYNKEDLPKVLSYKLIENEMRKDLEKSQSLNKKI